jgi:hypothetical protein
MNFLRTKHSNNCSFNRLQTGIFSLVKQLSEHTQTHIIGSFTYFIYSFSLTRATAHKFCVDKYIYCKKCMHFIKPYLSFAFMLMLALSTIYFIIFALFTCDAIIKFHFTCVRDGWIKGIHINSFESARIAEKNTTIKLSL